MNQSLPSTIYPHYNAVFQNSQQLKRHMPTARRIGRCVLSPRNRRMQQRRKEEPLLALCFGMARVLDQSLSCFFTYSDKLVAQLNGCNNSTSQAYARMR